MGEGAALCEHWFYHLERSPLELVLPEILEKTLARGWRALVRCQDPRRLEALDAALWIYQDDGFLPHGLASDRFPERQPVLLSDAPEPVNGAQALILLDAQDDDPSPYVRCMVMIDGSDEAAVQAARGLWRRRKAEGYPLAYWQQEQGRGWKRQA